MHAHQNPRVGAVLPSRRYPAAPPFHQHFRPPCSQYQSPWVPSGGLVIQPHQITGTCSANMPGNPFVQPDFVCNRDRRGRFRCRGRSSYGPYFPTPTSFCCNTATPQWAQPWSRFPARCCGQDNNACAKCVTRLEGNRTGNVASNHFNNMTRCQNNCFGVRTAGLDNPETRLLAHNTFM